MKESPWQSTNFTGNNISTLVLPMQELNSSSKKDMLMSARADSNISKIKDIIDSKKTNRIQMASLNIDMLPNTRNNRPFMFQS